MFRIIRFERDYQDDMFYCILSAKDALGKVPSINEDLYDIEKNYFNKGDMFWLAADENERVIGMLGTQTVSASDMWLKRLYIKPSMKRKGVGGALLLTAEEYARSKGISTIHTRFSDDYTEAARFYPSKGFVESERSEGLNHFIKML